VKKVSAVLVVLLVAILLVSVGAAQEPQIRPVSPAGVAGPSPAAPNPDDVLWDQYGVWTGTDFASQDFELAYDAYDIYAGDDFENGEPWSIDTIVTRGGWGYFVDLHNASALHWYIYADYPGKPAGFPGDGTEFWSISLAPTDAQVGLGVYEAEDVVLSLDTPVEVPPGHWWLVYFASLEYELYGQYGWSGTSDPVQGYVGMQANPNGGFGIGTDWVTNDYGEDFAFRLEGVPGPVEQPMFFTHVRIKQLAPKLLLGWARLATVGRQPPVYNADVTMEWEGPWGGHYVFTRKTEIHGLGFFPMKAPIPGVYWFRAVDAHAEGYFYDWELNWESERMIELK